MATHTKQVSCGDAELFNDLRANANTSGGPPDVDTMSLPIPPTRTSTASAPVDPLTANYERSLKSGQKVMGVLQKLTRTTFKQDQAENKFRQAVYDACYLHNPIRGDDTRIHTVSNDRKVDLGVFLNTYALKDGTISADYNFKPDEKKNGFKSLEQLSWSDIVFLTWKQMLKGPPTDLGRVAQHQIINEQTLDTIKYCYDKFCPEDAKFPNKYDRELLWFPADDNEAQDPNECPFTALLGTPNGVGAAYLLIDHADELGYATIECIRTKNLLLDPNDKGKLKEAEMVIEYTDDSDQGND